MMESQNDVDFYLLKISRMEEDMSSLQEELMTVRLRLRTAEDFQIKYQLLLKQSQQENYRLRIYEEDLQDKIHEALAAKLQEKQKIWKKEVEDKQVALVQSYEKEIDELRSILHDYENRSFKDKKKQEQFELLQFTNKKMKRQAQILEEEISSMKSRYEVSKEEQILAAKEQITLKYREKMESERKKFARKIEELEKQIEELKHKNIEDQYKTPLQNFQEAQNKREYLFEKLNAERGQIEKLTEQIQKKNVELGQMLDQRVIAQRTHADQKDNLKQYIKSLEDKIYSLETKQGDEIINLKQRMEAIREEECEVLRAQVRKVQSNLDNERDIWDNLIRSREVEEKKLKDVFEKEKSEIKLENKRLISKIKELKERLKQFGDDKQAGETENMIKSMKDFEKKSTELGSYENGVTFLHMKVNSCLAKIEEKNIEISQLRKELNDTRRRAEDEISAIYQKVKEEKKNHREKNEKKQEQINDLHEKLRRKELEHRTKVKALEGEIEILKANKKSLTEALEESKKDYNRITEAKKQVEISYRSEKEKSYASKTDISAAKKQKWVELQRQKNELELVYREKQQQLKKRLEIQSEQIRHERDRLLAENEKQKGIIENFKRNSETDDKQNRRKLYEDYEKKISTLNLEIAFTENMYHSFKKAKYQAKKDDYQEEDFSKSSQMENEELSMSFNPRSE